MNSNLQKKSMKEGRKGKKKDQKCPQMYSDGLLFSPMKPLSFLSMDFPKPFIILLIPHAKLFLVNAPVSLSGPTVLNFSEAHPNPHVSAAPTFLRVSQCHVSSHTAGPTQRSPLAQSRVSG